MANDCEWLCLIRLSTLTIINSGQVDYAGVIASSCLLIKFSWWIKYILISLLFMNIVIAQYSTGTLLISVMIFWGQPQLVEDNVPFKVGSDSLRPR